MTDRSNSNLFNLSHDDQMKVLADGGAGAAIGFATGFAAKKGAKIAVFGIGATLVFAQYLQSQGIINIEWKNIEQKSTKMLDINHDGKVDHKDLQALEQKGEALLKNRYGLGAGFAFGFLTGLRFG